MRPDYKLILDELRFADWSEPYGFRGRRSPLGTADDWRSTAVKALIRHDRTGRLKISRSCFSTVRAGS